MIRLIYSIITGEWPESKTKRIRELEEELAKTKELANTCIREKSAVEEHNRDLSKYCDLQTDRLNELQKTIFDIKADIESVPVDCTPGEYCRACEFSGCYTVSDGVYSIGGVKIYTCNKYKACKNFIQKEIK